MINKILQAKHWHLFLLIFALPMVIYMGWMINLFSVMIKSDFDYPGIYPEEFFNGMVVLLLLLLIPIAILYAWYWSMAIGLQDKLPEGMKMNTNLFKIFFIIPIIYLLLYFLFMISFFGDIENLENLENLEPNSSMFLIGFFFFGIFSLFIIFCVFYQYWFIAKTLKSIELQREALFGEFVGEFFLLWFYFVGVWLIQPTVNKIVSETINAE